MKPASVVCVSCVFLKVKAVFTKQEGAHSIYLLSTHCTPKVNVLKVLYLKKLLHGRLLYMQSASYHLQTVSFELWNATETEVSIE